MSKRKSAYEKLKDQGLTDIEIADAFVLPSELTEEERKESDEQLKKELAKRRANMTQEDKDEAERLRQKFIKEDNEKE
jgi:hypothetical protein